MKQPSRKKCAKANDFVYFFREDCFLFLGLTEFMESAKRSALLGE